MFPTLSLYSIAKKWTDILKDDPDIIDFCQSKYNKLPTIIFGFNVKKPPTKNECPYIIIYPEQKTEGNGQSSNPYSIFIGAGICNENEIITGNVIEMEGLKEIDDFMQLILLKIGEANPSYPISQSTMSFNSVDYYPQHIAEMTNEIIITPTIGGKLEY